MTATLFSLTFLLASPFWALMIFAPKWSWTKRIAESYLIVLPVVAIYVILMIPVLPELLPLVTRPELPALAKFMST
ncbi:MAG TPA: abscisic acid-deficient protein Aba4 family protein, partial [Lentzea sp.]